jgi:hypothetical protein
MGMPELTLYEQEVATGAKVSQVTIRMPKQLHAGPVGQACSRQDPNDPPVQPGAFEGPMTLMQDERLGRVVRGNAIGQQPRPNIGHVLGYQLAGITWNVDESLFCVAGDPQSRLRGAHKRISEREAAEFRIPQAGEEQHFDNEPIQDPGGATSCTFTDIRQQGMGLLNGQKHLTRDFPGAASHLINSDLF